MNLKQKLSKKLKKSGGFTLVEMLIVVAIIAILVAVSIPMVNANLKKAKEATDDANERAAKAAALADYLMDDTKVGTKAGYCYDANKGQALPQSTPGTCAHADDITDYGQIAKGHVHIIIETNGTTEVTWSK